jgi:hypothetical protein
MSQHVIPLDDSRDHEISRDCACLPLVDGTTVVHHAWDTREKFERQGSGDPEKKWGVFDEATAMEK